MKGKSSRRAFTVTWLLVRPSTATTTLVAAVSPTRDAGPTNRIGIRMALGAARWDVLRLITGDGLVGCGLVVGFTVAVALTRFALDPLETRITRRLGYLSG